MRDKLKKIGNSLRTVYGYSILLCLFAGGLTFFGYLIALIIGGETATEICVFIYKTIVPIIIYVSSVTVLFGLLSMYLCGETALSVKDAKKK